MAKVVSLVSVGLAADGWQRRELGLPWLLAMTKPVSGGVVATVQIGQAASFPRSWPEELWVVRGVGHEAALGLKPLLTLPPEPTLLAEGGTDGRPSCFELNGPDAVPEVAADITREIRAAGATFATTHGVDALVAALEARRDEAVHVQNLATLLAATGQGGRALATVERAVADAVEGAGDLDFARFARQLRRWVDAADSRIAPVEETLRLLPPSAAPPEQPSWGRARARSDAERKAQAAVRAQAEGRSHQDLVRLLAEEYQARGLEPTLSTLDLAAKVIEIERQPFGRLRAGMWAIKSVKDAIGEVGGRLRNMDAKDPEWLRPPARATYPAPRGRRWVDVHTVPDAGPVLVRAWREGVHRIGPFVEVCLWLDGEPGAPSIIVRLGEHALGTLPPEAATAFEADLTAAAHLYDEAIQVKGRLYEAAPNHPPLLEIELPR